MSNPVEPYDPYETSDTSDPYPTSDTSDPYPTSDASDEYPTSDTSEPSASSDASDEYPTSDASDDAGAEEYEDISEVVADVRPVCDEGETASSEAGQTTVQMLDYLSQRILQWCDALRADLDHMATAERQVAEYLNNFEVLRALTQLYSLTAEHGLDWANKTQYDTLAQKSSDLYDKAYGAFKSAGTDAGYPLPRTHAGLLATLARDAAGLMKLLRDREYIELISAIPAEQLCMEGVLAALQRLREALAEAHDLLAQTEECDNAVALVGEAWIAEGESPPPDLSVPSSVVALVSTSSAVLPGPDCLLQALLKVQFARDLAKEANVLRSMLKWVPRADWLSSWRVMPVSFAKFGRDWLKRRYGRVLDSFGEWLQDADRAALLDDFDGWSAVKYDPEQSASLLAKIEARLETPPNMPADAWTTFAESKKLPWAFAALNGVVFAASLIELGESVQEGAVLESGKALVDCGSSLATMFLPLIRWKWGQAFADTVGNKVALLGVVTGLFSFAIAARDHDEAGMAKAALTVLGSSLIAATAFFAMSNPVGLGCVIIGSLILIGLTLWDLSEWIQDWQRERQYHGGRGNAIIDKLIERALWTKFSYTGVLLNSYACNVLELSSDLYVIKDIVDHLDFFGLPPIFALDAAAPLAATEQPGFELFVSRAKGAIAAQASQQQPRWRTITNDGTVTAEETAPRARCVEVLVALGLDEPSAGEMLYWDRANTREYAPEIIAWQPHTAVPPPTPPKLPDLPPVERGPKY